MVVGGYRRLMSDADEVIQTQQGWAAAIVSNDPDQIASYQDPEG